ncbi:MAG: TolC family protein [Pseudomonadota bacterium]
MAASFRIFLSLFFVALMCTACPKPLPEFNPAKYAAAAQENMPPEKGEEPIDQTTTALEPSQETYALAEFIDIALKNSPATRYAWAKAMASSAEWATSRSSYWPSLEGTIEGAAGKIPQTDGGRSYLSVGLGLQYLLLDFGGRSAKAKAAREALVAANWNHNQSIQDVLRDVPQAYHTHVGDKALFKASEMNLKDAVTTLRATEARRAAGVSTISDVLQARASADQARVDLAQRKGAVAISKGKLATVVGWPANAKFEAAGEPGRLPVRNMTRDIDLLIEEAKTSRPDIGAAQAAVRQAEAQVEQARALPFPKLTGGGNLQWQGMRNADNTAYYGGLSLEIPIFYGFSMENSLRSARADLEAAKAQRTLQEQAVIEEVWDAYHNFNTASEQYKASTTLLVSANESYNASLARYKAGAADIVELLNTQNTLASARAELISSRMDLFNSYAELLHAVGERIEGPDIEERELSYEED